MTNETRSSALTVSFESEREEEGLKNALSSPFVSRHSDALDDLRERHEAFDVGVRERVDALLDGLRSCSGQTASEELDVLVLAARHDTEE
jgi:hypothetical protein